MRRLLLFSLLVTAPVLWAEDRYRFSTDKPVDGFGGTIKDAEGQYRFRTYDRWILVPQDSQVDVWAIDRSGRPIPGVTVETTITPTGVNQSSEEATASESAAEVDAEKEADQSAVASQSDPTEIAEEPRDLSNEVESTAKDESKPAVATFPEEQPSEMQWQRLAALRLRLGFGNESIEAKGGISSFDGTSQIIQYGAVIETIKDSPDDFRVQANYLGHLSTYTTEEIADGNQLDKREDQIRVDRLGLDIAKGIAGFFPLPLNHDLSAGLGLRLTTAPVFSGDGSGAGKLQADRYRTLGLVLDYRKAVAPHGWRMRANGHLGYLDKDIDTLLVDVDAVYLYRYFPALVWELGLRYQADNTKTEFDCPTRKVCSSEAEATRSEMSLFIGISTYIVVPEIEEANL